MPRFDVNAYIDVQERIGRFWTEHPEGRIETSLMSPPDDFTQCRYVARVYRKGEAHPAATGWAFEIAGGGGANQTSHEENCETSAIGRALANLGYATTREDRPSRQEMGKVARMEGQRGNQPQREQPRASGPGIAPEQAQGPVSGGVRAAEPPTISEKQIKYLFGLVKDLGLSNEDLHAQMYARYKVAHVPDLSRQQAANFINKLKANDLIDGEAPPSSGRVDPVEQRQQDGLAGVPEEPEWLRNATWA